MTITTTAVDVTYSPDGSTTSFALPFAFADADHVVVEINGEVLASGYSISGAGDEDGGTLTFEDAPAAGTDTLYAYRDTPLVQEIAPVNNASVFASVLGRGLDASVLRDQEIAARLQAAIDEAGSLIGLAGKVSLTALAAASGSALMGTQLNATGAVLRTQSAVNADIVNAAAFGAVGDGVTDDRAALQAAIDFCATFTKWPTLVIPGLCAVGASLKIDRPVDTMSSFFVIRGQGPGAGFRALGAFPVFDSNLAVTSDPLSEYVRWEGITFDVVSAATAAYVISQKFLRCDFVNCVFNKIKFVNCTIYLQQINVIGGQANRWTGMWCTVVASMYACTFGPAFMMEKGDSGFDVGAVQGVNLLAVTFEGATGRFWLSRSGRNLSILGCYTEKNALNDYTIANPPDGNVTQGVTMLANHMDLTTGNAADPDFYNVIWGNTQGAVSFGNSCQGGLHDDNQIVYGNLVVRDHAGGTLNRSGRPLSLRPSGTEPSVVVNARSGGGQALATQLVHGINYVEVVAAAGDSVKLPVGFAGMEVTVLNKGANAVQVWGTSPATVNGAGGGASLAAGAKETYRCVVDNQWFF